MCTNHIANTCVRLHGLPSLFFLCGSTVPAAMYKKDGEDKPRKGIYIITSFCAAIFWIMALSWVMVRFAPAVPTRGTCSIKQGAPLPHSSPPSLLSPHAHTHTHSQSNLFFLMLSVCGTSQVFFVVKLGCIIHIDKFTMSLVVIAAGTSVPDALSSVMVARDGFGNMAVSNAIGSNVFDILLGLGFPYLLKALIDGEDLHLIADGREQGTAFRKVTNFL